MYSNDFEAAFSCFLERRDYDEAANQLFTLARLAFAAGWQAAGGDPASGGAHVYPPPRRRGRWTA